ncbi:MULTISPECIES: hypothetical protein [Rhodococcus]|nr:MULTISPECIES: hypothetical protein [Rhodococcus]WKK11989.1 hypothetical protein QYN14_25505 [Rhodococcus ruber]WKK12062.1 hypothetical protein QYN14_00115 [Rhodococcus ruber]
MSRWKWSEHEPLFGDTGSTRSAAVLLTVTTIVLLLGTLLLYTGR